MPSTIISVSIPLDLAQYLEENKDISPSKALQARLYEIKEQRLKITAELIKLRNDLRIIAEEKNKFLAFIKDAKLEKDFVRWRDGIK